MKVTDEMAKNFLKRQNPGYMQVYLPEFVSAARAALEIILSPDLTPVLVEAWRPFARLAEDIDSNSASREPPDA